MTELELLLRKIELQKQWLWMLTNLTEEELGLPKGMTIQEAVDEALDKINLYLNELNNLKNGK